jgi:DNA-binding transcriptional LysR family regulator
MELTTLRYFRAIAQHQHMTRAARQLGVTQPALSAMMRKLEAEVGAALLDRTGKGVALTDAGRVFLQHAEVAIREADAATRVVRELLGLERGTIRLGGGATAITYLLPPVIHAVRQGYPALKFSIREAGSTQVAQAVASGELDLGIVTLPLTLADKGELLTMELVEDEMRLIAPERRSGVGISWPGSEPFRWKDIAGLPVVGFEAGSAVRTVIDQAAARVGVTLSYVMELRSIEGIKGMVAAGIGIGFVSRFALGAGEGVACRDSKLTRTLAVVRRRDRQPSPAVQHFERSLREIAGVAGPAAKRSRGR